MSGHRPVSRPKSKGVKLDWASDGLELPTESNHLDAMPDLIGQSSARRCKSVRLSAAKLGTTRSDPSSIPATGDVVTTTVFIPAARADSIPRRESSMATDRCGEMIRAAAADNRSSARRYGSGAGLPAATSSTAMTAAKQRVRSARSRMRRISTRRAPDATAIGTTDAASRTSRSAAGKISCASRSSSSNRAAFRPISSTVCRSLHVVPR